VKAAVHDHAGPKTAVERRRPAVPAPEETSEKDHVLGLQATVGNQAVTGLLAPDDAGACPCGGPPGACACGTGIGVQRAPDDDAAGADEEFVIPSVTGEGPGGEYEVYANNITLHGRANANYAGTTFSAQDVAVQRRAGRCTATGTMTSTFVVRVDVVLPPIPNGLNECQRRNAQAFIDNVLGPHEQAHVRAFEDNYNGSVETPFTVTACNAQQINAAIRPIHNNIDRPRQAAANAASKALDPFRETFDLDAGCAIAQAEADEGPEAAPSPPPEEAPSAPT
jgi:hypothetical protein